jgi:hypothetical protein
VGTERVKHRVGQGFFPLLTAGFVGCAMDGEGRGVVHIVFLSAESLSIVELVVESSVIMYRTIWRGVGS